MGKEFLELAHPLGLVAVERVLPLGDTLKVIQIPLARELDPPARDDLAAQNVERVLVAFIYVWVRRD